MQLIPVVVKGCHYVFIVDDEDYDWLMQFTWSGFTTSSGQVYASTRTSPTHTSLMHRMILGLETERCVVDHIDQDCFNNTKVNLRIVTQSENTRNCPRNLNGKCVFYDKTRNKWAARVRYNGERPLLGRFATEAEAVEAVRQFKTAKGIEHNL